MAMALRTMAAKLKQKISAAVQWVRVSSHAPAHADTNLDPFGLEFRRALEKIVEKHRKRRRNEALACAADLFLGFATSFQQVYALAQCDVYCSNYVTQAVQRIAVECGGAPSGQVYIDKCYITYSY
ncbi:uncharacterized protein [Triticum aestivum]|uniref:uncharacterized protein isoform X4 n=1 Tax=Triticum aestivum TaxID=4565 RepID=UPI001D01EC40|nr:uncharacterized protein LOC123128754 isoform X4 [Triticum aestivum]